MPDSYSCSVRVQSVTGLELGAQAVLVYEQGGGIDITPGTPDSIEIPVMITNDAAQIVTPGALLTLTLAKT